MMAHFETFRRADGATLSVVRLPDADTLRRRRFMAWAIAEALHHQQTAHDAWGSLGITEKLALASKILDLRRRTRGNDGGRYIESEIP